RTAYMELRIRQAREAGRHLELHYRPVPMSRIPGSVQRTVRVAEDAGFYAHGAFDWAELRAALRQAWREEEAPRGASTITQQLARNLYLSPRRSLWRKVREALIAVRMEHALSKRRIFELYLNVIELGPGIFGVQAASEHYFGVSIDRVGPDRAVRLAATIPSPLSDNPDTGTREFRWRVGLIGSRAFPAESAAADTLRPLPADSLVFPAESTALPGADSPASGAAGAGEQDAAAGALPSPDTVGGAPDVSGTDSSGTDTAGAVERRPGSARPDTSGGS
ncbi:MAG TPA: biosynthetic peptidoglycan transglycosylase, partial [Gemmatimonadota bacterium]|nr:biosynthetic peptidoglycan transglycosylase [Gemmatimonadota bacterium]